MNSNKEDLELKKIGLFDVINVIETTKIPWNELEDDYKKAFNGFMIKRFISSKEVYIPVIAHIDTLKLDDEQLYTLLCETVDNKRKHYFDYKSYKKNKKEKSDSLLEYAVSKEYEIGLREARYYINNINDEQIFDKLKNKWEDHYRNYGEK